MDAIIVALNVINIKRSVIELKIFSMIRTPKELRDRLRIVNDSIQEIQDFIGPDDPLEYDNREFKIRFPRRYLRSATYFRSRLNFIKDEILKKNIAYCLIEADLSTWLLNRTDIVGTLRGMIIKTGIIKMASIAESCIWHETIVTYGGRKRFLKRCNLLTESGRISEELRDNLSWLWKTREAIHLFLLGAAEYSTYQDIDYDRAFLTVRNLIERFNESGK